MIPFLIAFDLIDYLQIIDCKFDSVKIKEIVTLRRERFVGSGRVNTLQSKVDYKDKQDSLKAYSFFEPSKRRL